MGLVVAQRSFFDDEVSIRSAKSERTERCPSRTRGIDCPLLRNHWHVKRAVREIDMRIRVTEVNLWNDATMAKAEEHFQQPCNACRAESMSDIGFHRSDGAESCLDRVLTKCIRQSIELDGIAESRAGSVSLD